MMSSSHGLPYCLALLGFFLVLFCLTSAERAATCTAGTFAPGSKASVTCHFNTDISERSYNVMLLPNDLTKAASKYIYLYLCNWVPSLSNKVCQTEHGFHFNVTSNATSLTLWFTNITTNLEGDYKCNKFSNDHLSETCTLRVEDEAKETTTVTPENSTEPPLIVPPLVKLDPPLENERPQSETETTSNISQKMEIIIILASLVVMLAALLMLVVMLVYLRRLKWSKSKGKAGTENEMQDRKKVRKEFVECPADNEFDLPLLSIPTSQTLHQVGEDQKTSQEQATNIGSPAALGETKCELHKETHSHLSLEPSTSADPLIPIQQISHQFGEGQETSKMAVTGSELSCSKAAGVSSNDRDTETEPSNKASENDVELHPDVKTSADDENQTDVKIPNNVEIQTDTEIPANAKQPFTTADKVTMADLPGVNIRIPTQNAGIQTQNPCDTSMSTQTKPDDFIPERGKKRKWNNCFDGSSNKLGVSVPGIPQKSSHVNPKYLKAIGDKEVLPNHSQMPNSLADFSGPVQSADSVAHDTDV